MRLLPLTLLALTITPALAQDSGFTTLNDAAAFFRQRNERPLRHQNPQRHRRRQIHQRRRHRPVDHHPRPQSQQPRDPAAPWRPRRRHHALLLSALHRMGKRDYTIVQWDQRGGGRTPRNTDPKTITIDRMIGDGIELTQQLLKDLKQDKLILVGHSWGSFLGARAKARPDLYYAFVGTGQVDDTPRANVVGYEAPCSRTRRHSAISEPSPSSRNRPAALQGLQTLAPPAPNGACA